MVSKILPRLPPDSMSICALSASARSKWANVVVFNFDDDDLNNGHAGSLVDEDTTA